jgi:hypothetical protein
MQHDIMMRFSIAKTEGGWAWRTVGYDGRHSQEGLAASKRLAAALVIQDILRQACSPVPDEIVDRKAA